MRLRESNAINSLILLFKVDLNISQNVDKSEHSQEDHIEESNYIISFLNQNLKSQKQAFKYLKRNIQDMISELHDFEYEFEKDRVNKSIM